MPRSLCARASFSSAPTSTYPLWISDDLLAETFRNFTHRHRRYGSNVPGPLEARRRATKRKNTNLAHIGNGAPPVDPAIVLGAASQQGWWQKTQPPIAKSAPSLLPSWLFQPSIAPSDPNTQHSLEKDAFQQPLSLEAREEESYEELCRQIKKCTKLKTLRNVIASAGVNMRQHPELAETAFRHMLKKHSSDVAVNNSTLHEILTDPTLNPPGSRNHLILMQELHDNGVTRKTWDNVMFPAIQDALRLGLVGVEELQDMILLLPNLHCRSRIATTQDGEKIVSDYHRLLTCLGECKVLRLKDLDRTFVKEWYMRIAEGTPHDNAVTLLWRLRALSGKSDIEVVADLVTSKLQHLAQECLSITDKFKAWIIALPQDLRGPAILHTSQSLVASAMTGRISMAELERWYQTFSSLNTEACAHIVIDRSMWDQALSSRGMLTPGQNLLSLAWTVTYLIPNQQESSQLLSSFNFKEQFLEIFSGTSVTRQSDLLGQVIMTLDTLPLPAKENLYWHLQNFTDKSLVAMLGHRVHEDSLKLLLERDLTKLNDEQFYRWAKRNMNDTLIDTSHAATEDLDAFRSLAQNLIMKNKASFKIVNRILQHNLAIKFALPMWPDHVEYQKHEYGGQFNLDPAKVTDLVHQLAISFAVSPVIGPRSAFRYVYQLYLYLHRYGAPIHPLMARALWHAGVTRYGKDGTSTAQLDWCLFKVREIEGPKTADMLLWSAGFRRLRGEEMENHQSPTTKEPSLPPALQNSHAQRERYRKIARERCENSRPHPKSHVRHHTSISSIPLSKTVV